MIACAGLVSHLIIPSRGHPLWVIAFITPGLARLHLFYFIFIVRKQQLEGGTIPGSSSAFQADVINEQAGRLAGLQLSDCKHNLAFLQGLAGSVSLLKDSVTNAERLIHSFIYSDHEDGCRSNARGRL